MTQIVWVDYAPTGFSPDATSAELRRTIRDDISLLRRAGFTGLITYGSAGRFGRTIVDEAEKAGFRGLIVGVWDPENEEELNAAVAAADSPILAGYCVGNEGCDRRYTYEILQRSIQRLRIATGKPVTTSEEFDDYYQEKYRDIGDWVFPNAHPYFHGRFDTAAAVRWTSAAYKELCRSSRRFVWFKEVGLPTAGDETKPLSELAQEEYYVALAELPVMFAFFEAFDQPWKTPGTIEPHWGLFRADRTPKRLARRMIEDGPLQRPDFIGSVARTPDATAGINQVSAEPFFVYTDGGSEKNHFAPTGLDGDCGDIQVNEFSKVRPRSGDSCIKVVYSTLGTGPNQCAYDPPCKWASLAWRHPPNNNGRMAELARAGFDLTGYQKLVFWARTDAPCELRFSVGGVDEEYGDSLVFPRSMTITLDTEWRQFSIDLWDADLSHIISGFGWSTNWDTNPEGATFYLDDIRFE